MNIFGLAPNPWTGQWVNRQQILSRFAKRHHVLYSNGAWTVWDRTTEPWHSARLSGECQYHDGVLVESAPKYLLRWPSRPILDQPVVAVHARRLRRLLGTPSVPSVALIFDPAFYRYATALRTDVVAYHAYDLFEATSGWTKEQECAENALIAQADLVTTVSKFIAERLEARTGRSVRLLPNGVDFARFALSARDVPVPADLASIPQPRLGYVGSIHPQIDFGLVARVAQSRPDWSVVFVGGDSGARTAQADAELAKCKACKNVYFLGDKQHSQVPAYVQHMDVNLLLYRLTGGTWVTYCYPLKLHEYLAAGKPVVSVDLPAVREFNHVVSIAKDTDDWLRSIESALNNEGVGTVEQRRAVAAENTWDSRVDRLEHWLIAALQNPESGKKCAG